MENKIVKQLFPEAEEKHLERAFKKLKKDGCPEDEDLLVWFSKLVEAERKNDLNGADDE